METKDRSGSSREKASLLQIPLPELFSWPAVLGYLTRSSDEALYRVDGSEVTKLFEREGELALVRFRYREGAHALEAAFLPIGPAASVRAPAGPAFAAREASAPSPAPSPAEPDEPAARPDSGLLADGSAAALGASPPSAAMLAHVRRYAEEWFDLDRDLAPFYRLTDADPLLREVGQTLRGLRMVGIPDLFEAACWGIIGQQINLPFAYALKKRFTETFGSSVQHEGETYWSFPKPEAVAALEPPDIAALQMTTRKSEYLIGVAGRVADGTLDKRELEAADWAEAEKRLTAIRGIGPWTAHYVMMRCLRMAEALPAADVGLQHAIRIAAGMDRKPTAAEVREQARAWAGWEAYATFYLWRTLY